MKIKAVKRPNFENMLRTQYFTLQEGTSASINFENGIENYF